MTHTDNNNIKKSLLIENKKILNDKLARYYTIDGNHDITNAETAHFYGGNGFAVGCYEPLLTELSTQFNIVSLGMRGSWYEKPTAQKLTREEDADILIDFLEKTQTAPVIGIGHSQGATSTALACAKRPDLFKELYLIEPVTFTRRQVRLYNLLPRWFLNMNEPFKSTLKKQTVWNSPEEYYRYLRKVNAFKRISDEHLRIYAENSLEKTGDTYSLIFPPEQELANYFGVPFIDDALLQIKKNGTPFKLLIGKPSIFVSEDVRNVWKGFVPAEAIEVYPEYGHLLPIENHSICVQSIFKNYQ